MTWVAELTILLATSAGALVGIGGLLLQSFKIRHELRPNHGESMRDAIDQIDDRIRSLGHQIGETRKDLQQMRADQQLSRKGAEKEFRRLEQRIDRYHGN